MYYNSKVFFSRKKQEQFIEHIESSLHKIILETKGSGKNTVLLELDKLSQNINNTFHKNQFEEDLGTYLASLDGFIIEYKETLSKKDPPSTGHSTAVA